MLRLRPEMRAVYVLFLLFFCIVNGAGRLNTDIDGEFAVDNSSGSAPNRFLQEAHYEELLRTHVTSELLRRSLADSKTFLEAKPFPHFIISNIFPKEVLRTVSKEIRDAPKLLEGCTVEGICFNDGKNQKSHIVFSDVRSLGPATNALHQFLRSRPFLQFLQHATGLDDLTTGSETTDAGVHQFLSSSFEKVHTDFNMDQSRGLHRRLNVYLYLNHQWRDEYGGHLELWSRDLQRCEAHISPDLGKLVVFSSTDFSYHGHQAPLTCPPHRSNRLLAVYYYTRGRPSSECLNDNCFKVRQERYPETSCPVCAGVCAL